VLTPLYLLGVSERNCGSASLLYCGNGGRCWWRFDFIDAMLSIHCELEKAHSTRQAAKARN